MAIVRACLRTLMSSDIGDLPSFKPAIADDFGFPLRAMFGPNNSEGEESFDMLVCTPKWMQQEVWRELIVMGRHYLVVEEYDFDRIRNFIIEFANGCSGETWRDVALKLSRLGFWEFEDYRGEP